MTSSTFSLGAPRTDDGRGLFFWLAIGAVLVLLVLGLRALIGPERSAAAVCDVFAEQSSKYIDDMAEARQGGLFSNAGALIGVPARMADMYGEMADVAPKDAEPSFRRVAKGYEKAADSMSENAGHPLRALGTSLALGFSTRDAERDTQTFLRENCPNELAAANKKASE